MTKTNITLVKRTIRKILPSLLLLSLAFVSLSCKDDKEDSHSTSTASANGIYILCQGNIGHNNSAIDFYSLDSNKIAKDIFLLVNGQGLGDTGNDMIVFGDNIFVSVEESACVSVINKNTGKLVKRIATVDANGTNRTPFALEKSDSKVFVSTYDGHVLSINPSTLTIEKTCSVGRNPEDLCYCNGYLYVSNSGGLEYTSGNYDTTVSVVNTSTMQEEKRISVGKNPGQIKKINSSLIGVIVRGDYSNVKFLTINTSTQSIANTFLIPMSSFDILNGQVLYTNYNYSTSKIDIKMFDPTIANPTQNDFISTSSSLAQLTTPSNIIVDNAHSLVYITDCIDYISSGKVFVFNPSGSLLYSFATSINPCCILNTSTETKNFIAQR